MKIWIGISTKVYQGYTCISTLYCYTYTFSVYQHPFFVLSTHTPILYMIFRVMIMIVKVYRPPISWYTANHPIAGANVHWGVDRDPAYSPICFPFRNLLDLSMRNKQIKTSPIIHKHPQPASSKSFLDFLGFAWITLFLHEIVSGFTHSTCFTRFNPNTAERHWWYYRISYFTPCIQRINNISLLSDVLLPILKGRTRPTPVFCSWNLQFWVVNHPFFAGWIFIIFEA